MNMIDHFWTRVWPEILATATVGLPALKWHQWKVSVQLRRHSLTIIGAFRGRYRIMAGISSETDPPPAAPADQTGVRP